MNHYHIYGLGAALVDTEIEVTDEFLQTAGIQKGVMTLVDEKQQQQLLEQLKTQMVGSRRASGGSACNTIIAASYFGANTYYSCRIANDDNGQFFIKDTQAAGTQIKEQAPLAGTTGKCLVMITPDAERTMHTFLGASSEVSVDDLDEDALSQSDYFYTEGYLVASPTGKAAVLKARQIAKQSGVKSALSLSDPAMVGLFKEGLEEMVGTGVDLLFCNRDEAMGWTQAQTLQQAVESLKATAKSFAITLGAEGALVYDGAQAKQVAGSPANALDTNGAGDMFAGAFLYAITQGEKDYFEAAALANRAAAMVVGQYGPRLKPQQHRSLIDS